MSGRIPIVDVQPSVDGGQYAAKAVVGERFAVSATVFREGHDAVNATVVLRGPRGEEISTPMRPTGALDRWAADVTPASEGDWTFTVEAWGDPVETWRHRAEIKIPADLDTELELREGALVLERAIAGMPRGGPASR